MLRRLFLAVLVCLSVWALAGRVADGSNPVTVAVAGIAAASPDLPEDASGPQAGWDAPPPFSGGVSGSSWSSQVQLQYLDVAGISRRDDTGRVTRAWGATRRPTHSRSPHLHDIPLLI